MTNAFLRKYPRLKFEDGDDSSAMSRREAEHSKVTPLVSYPVPAYPTISEISQADLARVPARWQSLKSVAASLGAAAMTLRAISLEAAGDPKPPEPTPVAAVPVADKVKDEVKETRPATAVCPLPPEKIAGEGRGAFGCIVVSPPVFLPEDEAFDIIKAEFKKHGIELVEGVELKGGKAPPQGDEAKKLMMTVKEFEKSGGKVDGFSTSLGAPLPLVKRDWKADFGTKDGKVVVEYVSGRDEQVWNRTRLSNHGWCSVSDFDIREAAARVVEGASARREGEPITVGVFYDPVAKLPSPRKDDGSIDWDAAREIPWEERDAKGKALAVKQLTAQIEAFFEYLAKKNASDASSH